jgi:penicillin amidase
VILRTRSLRLDGERGPIHLWRSREGVVHVSADDEIDLARGLGFAHAHDRLAQMMLGRLVGQGRLSECLRADDDTLAIDVAMSRMAMARDAHRDVANLTDEARAHCEAYAAGVNHYLERRRPAELRLAGYQPEPWRAAD